MLEFWILQWLMEQEGRDLQTGGNLLGYNVSYIQKKHAMPKSTFYRAVSRLIDNGLIVKQQRNQYICSDSFRILSNAMKNSDRVKSVREIKSL